MQLFYLFSYIELRLLEKYKDKVDWQGISENENILWTTSILEKYKDSIYWEILSENGAKNLFTIDILEKFKSYWNWSNLSGNRNIDFSLDLINRFVEYWDWERIIDNWNFEYLYSKEFLFQYKNYIPKSSLQRSRLWDTIVENEKKLLEREIVKL